MMRETTGGIAFWLVLFAFNLWRGETMGVGTVLFAVLLIFLLVTIAVRHFRRRH